MAEPPRSGDEARWQRILGKTARLLTRGGRLDALGQPSIGVGVGGPFGPGAYGGVSALFGDQLSDQQIYALVQANGTVRDIGGQIQYINLKNRWNYGAGLAHIPSDRLRRARTRRRIDRHG